MTEQSIDMTTYFIVGTDINGEPGLYLGSEVPGFTRVRESSLRESRRVIKAVADELDLRAVAENTVAMFNMAQQRAAEEQSPGARVKAAMQARMDEINEEATEEAAEVD